MMKSEQGDVLPQGYTRLEFVQGTGLRSLSIEINPLVGDNIVIDMQDVNTYNQNVVIFGHNSAGGSWVGRDRGNGYYTLGGANTIPIKTAQRVVGRIELSDNLYTLAIGEQVVKRAINKNGHYQLFGNGTAYCSKAKVYSLVIYRDGSAISNLVPCTNENDEIGFYDTIRATFLKY